MEVATKRDKRAVLLPCVLYNDTHVHIDAGVWHAIQAMPGGCEILMPEVLLLLQGSKIREQGSKAACLSFEPSVFDVNCFCCE